MLGFGKWSLQFVTIIRVLPDGDSFPVEHERWRLVILVESLRRARKSALRVGAVKKLHRDVEHHNICGCHTTA
jgi:hypothetical protein